MSENLKNEVENFFAEIDAISNVNFGDKDTPCVPTTNWIVQVDPKTGVPFYYNVLSKKSTWDVPDDYQAYLNAYELYLKNEKVETEKNPLVPVVSQPDGNARKRRRVKRAWMRGEPDRAITGYPFGNGPVEFLSEYIAYSNSSSEEESSCSGSSQSLKSPEIKNDNSTENNESAVDHDSLFIGPQLPVICEPVAATPKNELIVNNLHELSQLLLEKFAAIDPKQDKLSDLQVAFIQFNTRLEDWKDGHLSEARYEKKLLEVDSFLRNYERSSLPTGWSSCWDSENKQYTYAPNSPKVENSPNAPNALINNRLSDLQSIPDNNSRLSNHENGKNSPSQPVSQEDFVDAIGGSMENATVNDSSLVKTVETTIAEPNALTQFNEAVSSSACIQLNNHEEENMDTVDIAEHTTNGNSEKDNLDDSQSAQ